MSKIRIKQIEDIDTADVYLDTDLKITTKVGEVKTFDSGKNYATISSTKAGGQKKTVQEVLQEIFSKDNNPTVTNPSVSIAIKNGQSTISADTYIEVGTSVTITPNVTFNPGSYQYGPATGCTASDLNASLMNGSTKVGDDITRADGTISFPSHVLGDGDVLTVKGNALYGAGAVPFSQLGSEVPSLAIAAGTTPSVTSKAIRAFRPYFYGADISSSRDVDSAVVRALTASTVPAAADKTFNISATASTKRMIVAVKKDVCNGLTAILTTSMNADISANFVKQSSSIRVNGANGGPSTEYDVWIFLPDTFQGNEVVKITLK